MNYYVTLVSCQTNLIAVNPRLGYSWILKKVGKDKRASATKVYPMTWRACCLSHTNTIIKTDLSVISVSEWNYCIFDFASLTK